jgi:hypothetical protein
VSVAFLRKYYLAFNYICGVLGQQAESSDHLIVVHGLKYLIALPLSAGRKVDSEFVLGALSDVLSAPVKFSLDIEKPLTASVV